MNFYAYGYTLNSVSYINSIILNNIYPVNFISWYHTTNQGHSQVYNNKFKSIKGKLISPYIISYTMNNTITDFNQIFGFDFCDAVYFPNFDINSITEIFVKKKVDKVFTDCNNNQIIFAIKTNLRFILLKNQKDIEVMYSHFETFAELIFNPICTLNKNLTYINGPSFNISSLAYSINLTNNSDKFSINIKANNNNISQTITVNN
jgi:hypothetical protein